MNVLIASLLLLLAPAPAPAASTRPAGPASAILGVWRGKSICTDRKVAPACKDESVVYTVVPVTPPSPQKVLLKASKIVAGKAEPMGDLEFTWEPKKGIWQSEFKNARVHAMWNLRVDGSDMAGTLVDIPSKSIVREVQVHR